jgi:hypothetical protein
VVAYDLAPAAPDQRLSHHARAAIIGKTPVVARSSPILDHSSMGSRLACLALLGSGAALVGCDLFHDTDWSTQCPSASDASCTGGASVSSASGEGGVGSAHSTPGSGGMGAAGGSTSSSAGTGGHDGPPCEGVAGGVEHDGHCYVSGSNASPSWDASRSECEAFGAAAGKQGDLVVLDSVAELTFLVRSFLQATATEHDTWIGYQCDAALHPDAADCGCSPCADQAELDAKRANWSWINGLASGFKGWIAGDPNASGRCAAVTLDDLVAYGMVDRPCDSQVWDVDGVLRTYRTVCEVE